MITSIYQKVSVYLLLGAALSLPWLVRQSDALPTNNRIETWLPDAASVRVAYKEFRSTFGAEEVVLVAVAPAAADDALLEALSRRIELLPGVQSCWSPERFTSTMQDLGVPEDAIAARLTGLALSPTGALSGLVVGLSDEGIRNRANVVSGIQSQIDYCQLRGDDVAVAGAPVVVTELDRLGARDQNALFNGLMLLISLGLLYRMLRQWKLAVALVGLTVWAVQFSMAIVGWFGGEMNFVLGAMSAMVLVFTLSTSIHILHYCSETRDDADPVRAAIGRAARPCGWSTLTTIIGLISLGVSDIGPVRQFGFAGAAGCAVSLFTGLFLTPAAVTLFPLRSALGPSGATGWNRWSDAILPRSRRLVFASMSLIVITLCGLARVQSRVDPLDFLPREGKVLADVRRVERDLTSITSIEAVVDFGERDRPFIETLADLRRIETEIASHPAVRHTMSAATFFPEEFPDDSGEAIGILTRARSRQGNSGFISRDGSQFRISARLNPDVGASRHQVMKDLIARTQGEPIAFTGIAPLLDSAQNAIFTGLWESFAMAFGVITVVMMVALRSVTMGLLAMIPNLTPITIVFGMLGWLGLPVDIGTMMTASIALGIAVDGTFHFMVRWQAERSRGLTAMESARETLQRNGAPILDSALVAGLGMMAMLLSPFTPMAHFGGMMMALLAVALLGDLVLLPTLLCFRQAGAATCAPSEMNIANEAECSSSRANQRSTVRQPSLPNAERVGKTA